MDIIEKYLSAGRAETLSLLSRSPFFAGSPSSAIEALVDAAHITHSPPGAVIIEEGEYEMICYVVLHGGFRIFVTDKETGEKKLVRDLGAGDLFGEMSIVSGAPRGAEVVCVEEAILLRIDREGFLKFLDASPPVRARLDSRYRERALAGALKMVDVFSAIEKPVMARLAQTVELRVYRKGEVIFEAGGRPEAFYLIRDGFVQMARDLKEGEAEFFDSRFDKTSLKPGAGGRPREFIMGYLGQGAYFGERALFDNRPRTATATAVTRVELVRICRKDFESLMFNYPEVRAKMKEIAASRYSDTPGEKTLAGQDMLRWVASQDMLAADAVLILDLDLCVRCLHCIEACASLHGGVTRITHNGIRHKNILIPTSCRHCREPTCMIGCPTGAIQRDPHGEVYHTDACIGCGNCARRCPFGNISIVELNPARRRAGIGGWLDAIRGAQAPRAEGGGTVLRKAVKCDMCMDYDHLGCQHNCPTSAIQSVKPWEYFAQTGSGAR